MDAYAAAVRELDGIGQQVRQHLLDSAQSANDDGSSMILPLIG